MTNVETIAGEIDDFFNRYADAKCVIIAPSHIWRCFINLIKPFPCRRTPGSIIRSPESYIRSHYPGKGAYSLQGMSYKNALFVIGFDFVNSRRGEEYRYLIDFYDKTTRGANTKILYGDWN